MTTPQLPEPGSTNWSSTTKLIVGLSIVAIIAAFLIQFRFIIGPLLMAFVLAYLLHPLAGYFSRLTHLSWKASVNLVFFVFVTVLLALVFLVGLALVQQGQSLYLLVVQFVDDLPALAEEISSQTYALGPFVIDFSQYNLGDLVNQVLTNLQGPLSRIGSIITSLASGTLGTLGWILFILVIAFFLLTETESVTDTLVPIELPFYNPDMRQLGVELRKIWNRFLRGQVALIALVIISYSIMLLAFGVRYSLALALLIGLARLVPYIGPLVAWATTFVVIMFQSGNYFGLQQWLFGLIVIGIGILLDQVFDNVVSPRMLGERLGIHPAALLVMAIVAANLLGVVGLILAAPALATFQLMVRYVTRKMLELDPFPPEAEHSPEQEGVFRRMKVLWRYFRNRLNRS
jgi:predicted PurR-regulated permease PerM